MNDRRVLFEPRRDERSPFKKGDYRREAGGPYRGNEYRRPHTIGPTTTTEMILGGKGITPTRAKITGGKMDTVKCTLRATLEGTSSKKIEQTG
jgi:hypothetical protein